jgi:hypothetical protein
METKHTNANGEATTTTSLPGLTTFLRTDTTGRAYTRTRWHATKIADVGAASFELTVSLQDGGGYRSRWSCNRGAGWMKAHRSILFATELEATTHAARKLTELCKWISGIVVVAGPGITSDMYTITR